MLLEALNREFASAWSQESRLLKLRFKQDSLETQLLTPAKLEGSCELSQGFEYKLECLSAQHGMALKNLIGQPIEVGLLTDDGSRRSITGIVSEAETLGSDGHFARYGLTIHSALALLELRRTSRVFQEMNVMDIVQSILDEHRATNTIIHETFDYKIQLTKEYSPRSYCLQYRENDAHFIQRILAEEGIGFRWTHQNEGTPLHTMVFFDAPHTIEPSSRPNVRFLRSVGSDPLDTIHSWESERKLTPGKVSLASFDYKPVRALESSDESQQKLGKMAAAAQSSLEDYDVPGAYYGSETQDLQRYASLRQQAHDFQAKRFIAKGDIRHVGSGEWLNLSDHPSLDLDLPEDRQFVVVKQSLVAINNLPNEITQLLGNNSSLLAGLGLGAAKEDKPAPFDTQLTLVRRGTPLVNRFSQSDLAKPTANGVQTAIVVGLSGEEVLTDELGRIRVQFHWQRPQEHPGAGASFDERSSCWLRVVYPSAGDGWGHQFIPRAGQEVLVNFLEGDIDRPIVTGVIYNGSHQPPKFSGSGALPGNQALSGIKTQEYKGSGYNELLFDDTKGQLRTKLSSEHGKTQLNMGYLAHPRGNGAAEPRGEGFELRTDKQGAIRANEGLLLTATGQPGASGKQLSRSQLIQGIKTAVDLTQSLAKAASQQHADNVDDKAILKLVEALEAWEKGLNTDTGKSDASAGGKGIVAVESPNGMALSTGGNLALASLNNTDIVSQKDIHQTAGKRLVVNAADSISLFSMGNTKESHSIKMIAGQKDVSIESHTDSVELLAGKNIDLHAAADVVINAKNKLTFACGGAAIVMEGGNVTITAPGSVKIKTSQFNVSSGGSVKVAMPALPTSEFANKHSLRFTGYGSDSTMKDMGLIGKPYQITNSTGVVVASGTIPKSGRIPRVMVDQPDMLTLAVGGSAPKITELPPVQAPEPVPSVYELNDDHDEQHDPYYQQIVLADDEDFLHPDTLDELLG